MSTLSTRIEQLQAYWASLLAPMQEKNMVPDEIRDPLRLFLSLADEEVQSVPTLRMEQWDELKGKQTQVVYTLLSNRLAEDIHATTTMRQWPPLESARVSLPKRVEPELAYRLGLHIGVLRFVRDEMQRGIAADTPPEVIKKLHNNYQRIAHILFSPLPPRRRTQLQPQSERPAMAPTSTVVIDDKEDRHAGSKLSYALGYQFTLGEIDQRLSELDALHQKYDPPKVVERDCNLCGTRQTNAVACRGCQSVFYCDKHCQEGDAEYHAIFCPGKAGE
jgi:hypothetical protein